MFLGGLGEQFFGVGFCCWFVCLFFPRRCSYQYTVVVQQELYIPFKSFSLDANNSLQVERIKLLSYHILTNCLKWLVSLTGKEEIFL